MNLRDLLIVVITFTTAKLFHMGACFKTGTVWFGQPTSPILTEATHYSMTACALYQMAARYIEHVYNINNLEAQFTVHNGFCTDFHMVIASEIEKMNYNPAIFRVALQEIAASNIDTDLSYDDVTYAHFDAEEFERGARFLTMLARALQSSMERQEWIQTRMILGKLFHSLQDFYSHSNWIELGMREPNRDLATGRNIGSVAGATTPTCKECDGSKRDCVQNNLIISDSLTTGYFAYYYPVQKPLGKCNHGYTCSFDGVKDQYCEGISKDGLRSPHGHLHSEAVKVAYNATIKILTELWITKNTDAFGKVLGLSNSFSLVLVIDVSNRLQSLIEIVKFVSDQLSITIENLTIKPNNYILSPFNGSHWGPIYSVTKLVDFVDLILKLNENDLRHRSQCYYDALSEALKLCESDSVVFLFTDAPAHKTCSVGPTRALAKMKKTKVDIIFINESRSVAKAIKELIHIADVTGGLFTKINVSQPNVIQALVHRRLYEVFSYECILHQPIPNHRQGVFMIDSTAAQLRIVVMSLVASFSFSLKNPKGFTSELVPSTRNDFIQTFTINLDKNQDIGKWMYFCSENCSVEVSIKSKFRCRTHLYATLSDDVSELVTTPPLVNQTEVYAITTCDNSSDAVNVSLRLVSKDGKMLKDYVTTKDFVMSIEIPSQSFYIYSRIGRNDHTFAYRQERALIDTSQIVVAIKQQPLIAINDTNFNITYVIRNFSYRRLYIQLNIEDVLKAPKWYLVRERAKTYGSVIIDTTQYQVKDEAVRFIPLIFTLQAFKERRSAISGKVLYRHEQIVPLYVQSSPIHLKAPTHFIKPI